VAAGGVMEAKGRTAVTRRPKKLVRVMVTAGVGWEGGGVPVDAPAAAAAVAAFTSTTRAARDRMYGLVNQWTRPGVK